MSGNSWGYLRVAGLATTSAVGLLALLYGMFWIGVSGSGSWSWCIVAFAMCVIPVIFIGRTSVGLSSVSVIAVVGSVFTLIGAVVLIYSIVILGDAASLDVDPGFSFDIGSRARMFAAISLCIAGIMFLLASGVMKCVMISSHRQQ